MPEEVLFVDERRQHRTEIAEYLTDLAGKLESGDPITFVAGERSVTVDPPGQPAFEIKVERETAAGSDAGEMSVEIEIEWDESATDRDSLSIE